MDETPQDEAPAQEVAAHDLLLQRIRERAFEISSSPDAGSADDDWLRAEREVLAESGLNDTAHRSELDEAREAESSALWNAELRAYGHP